MPVSNEAFNATLDRSQKRLEDLTTLQIRVGTLFAAIAHGDDKHRAWLKQAIEDHFAGRPVQRPQ